MMGLPYIVDESLAWLQCSWVFKLGFNEGVGEEASGEIVTGAPAKTSALSPPNDNHAETGNGRRS